MYATVIDVDSGIGMTLPEFIEDVETVEVPKDRMAALLINETGDVLLDGQPISLISDHGYIKTKNSVKDRFAKK